VGFLELGEELVGAMDGAGKDGGEEAGEGGK